MSICLYFYIHIYKEIGQDNVYMDMHIYIHINPDFSQVLRSESSAICNLGRPDRVGGQLRVVFLPTRLVQDNIYICIYIYLFIYIFINKYIYIYINTYIYIQTAPNRVRADAARAGLHTYVHVYMYICVYIDQLILISHRCSVVNAPQSAISVGQIL